MSELIPAAEFGEEAFDPVLPDPEKLAAKMRPRVVSDGASARAQVLMRLMDDLPLNTLGLPDFIYRTDLLPSDYFSDAYSDEERFHLQQASMYRLDYSEGYPCQMDGTPLWSQLLFEPIAAFQMFVQYLGVIHAIDEQGRFKAPIRTLSATSAILNVSEMQLREMAYLYFWPLRAKAYDMFMVANFQRQREMRALTVEDAQYLRSQKWMQKVSQRLEEIFEDEDLLYDVKPADLMRFFKDLSTMERISAGLPANGPGEAATDIQGAGLKKALQAIAQRSGEGERTSDKSAQVINNLLEDPEAFAALQDLIIKGQVAERT